MSRPLSYSSYIAAAEQDAGLKVPKHIWAATLENPTQEGAYLSEEEYDKLQTKLFSGLDLNEYETREDAKQDIQKRISNLGIIEYFVLRAVIAWLVESILDLFFGRDT